MVEVEPAKEVLIRLPAAAVLRDDHTRNRFEDLSRSQDGALFEVCLSDSTLRGRVRDANQFVGSPDHGHVFDVPSLPRGFLLR